ncbi:hypothetical protein ACWGIU_34860 [Streptomyces sp. NPDC054840]
MLRRESAYESAAARAFTELTARLVRDRRGYRPPRRAHAQRGGGGGGADHMPGHTVQAR